MRKLYIIRGLPGSGKSTLARDLLRSKTVWYHYEADMYFIKDSEYKFNKKDLSLAHEWCFNQVKFALENLGESCAVSNTFTQKWEMQKYIDLCNELGCEYQIITCNGDYGSIHDVPDKTLADMKKRFDWSLADKQPQKDRFLPDRCNDKNLPLAILVDIDGTLALNKGTRSPYDEARVGEDDVCEQVKKVVNILSENFNVIIVSGRSELCRNETIAWLDKHKIMYKNLLMRKNGDTRKDSIVKKEIYEQISQDYFVDFVIDDRKQVKRMWNELRVFVFDVNQFDIDF